MWLGWLFVEWYLYRFIFPCVVLLMHFNSLDRWFKILLCINFVVSTCEVIHYLQETINNGSQSVGGMGHEYFHNLFTTFNSFKPFKDPFELALNTEESTVPFSLLYLLPVIYITLMVYFIFRVTKEIYGKVFPRVDNDEWQGRWEKIGQVLKEYSAPVVWKFTPQQIQDPVKVAEYLKEKRCPGSREEQLTALCWALATLYRALLDTSQPPQEEEEEEENRPTSSMATQTAAVPEEQPMLGAAAPEQNTSNTKLVSLVRDEEDEESSEEEEEAQITQESQRRLQSVRERYRRRADQSLLLWLYECWFAGAHEDVWLDSSEAQQLGCLSQDVAIDRGLGRRAGRHSLWMRLVGSVRAAYTAEELLLRRDSWSTRLEGVEYLTELSMADILFGNTQNSRCLDDLDRACCTWDMWQALRRSAPPLYAKALSSITWNRNLKVLKLKAFIWDYRLKPSSPPQHSSSYEETQPREQAACGDDLCTICHEELGRNSCELECGHEFHRECIRTWLLLHSSTCPICREYAVLPADIPARNNSQPHKARPWKRSRF